MNGCRLTASRTALVATAMNSCAPCASAVARNFRIATTARSIAVHTSDPERDFTVVAAIAKTPDVIDVESGELERVIGREYRIRYKVRTTYGAVAGTTEITTP